jgi:protein gp37
MKHTKIDWCEWTWNPAWGCKNNCQTPAGKPYCYARKINEAHPRIKDFNTPELSERVNAPFPANVKLIFVNSMSDVCYWKEEWLDMVLDRIKQNPDRVFIFLTKGYRYFREHIAKMDLPNMILGLTATNRQQFDLVYPEGYWLHNELQHAKLLLNIEPIFHAPPSNLFRGNIWSWVIVGALQLNYRTVDITDRNILDGIQIAKDTIALMGMPVFYKSSLLFQKHLHFIHGKKPCFYDEFIPGMEPYKKIKADKEQAALRDKGASVDQIELKLW